MIGGAVRSLLRRRGPGFPRLPVGADLVADAGQAAAAGQVELPAVQLAGQHVAVDDAEPGQVGLQVRAAPLHDPVAERDVLGVGGALVLVVPALGVLQPLLGQALEERVDELVVLADPGRREAAGQEQRVDPVDLVDVEQVLDQRPLGPEAVAHLLVGVRPDLLAREVDHDRLDRSRRRSRPGRTGPGRRRPWPGRSTPRAAARSAASAPSSTSISGCRQDAFSASMTGRCRSCVLLAGAASLFAKNSSTSAPGGWSSQSVGGQRRRRCRAAAPRRCRRRPWRTRAGRPTGRGRCCPRRRRCR